MCPQVTDVITGLRNGLLLPKASRHQAVDRDSGLGLSRRTFPNPRVLELRTASSVSALDLSTERPCRVLGTAMGLSLVAFMWWSFCVMAFESPSNGKQSRGLCQTQTWFCLDREKVDLCLLRTLWERAIA